MKTLVENEDYELIPGTSDDNIDEWNVRFLSGDFVESVIRYGKVTINGEEEEMTMSFDFDVVSSPIPDLSENVVELQEFAGDVLISIIENSITKSDKETTIE